MYVLFICPSIFREFMDQVALFKWMNEWNMTAEPKVTVANKASCVRSVERRNIEKCLQNYSGCETFAEEVDWTRKKW